MKPENRNTPVSRRKFLGVSLALPFLPIAKPLAASPLDVKNQDSEFITMLTAEGKTVRVKKDALCKAKVIEKKMSNKSLLDWLKPKGFKS